jgi:hypothetical protein
LARSVRVVGVEVLTLAEGVVHGVVGHLSGGVVLSAVFYFLVAGWSIEWSNRNPSSFSFLFSLFLLPSSLSGLSPGTLFVEDDRVHNQRHSGSTAFPISDADEYCGNYPT